MLSRLFPAVSPEVREYAEVQRERDYYAVNAEVERKWQHTIGAKALDVLRLEPEMAGVEGEIIVADEAINRVAIEARAHELIAKFEPSPKTLRENEAEDNARTALFEALTSSGHMSVVELEGELNDVHEQVMRRLLNSYFREGIAQHEKARNFAEICEELTVQATFEAICRGDMPPDTKVLTVSDFAHPLGDQADKHGYRSANQKGMVRETMLGRHDGKLVRVIKQVSRSNTYAPGTIDKLQRANLLLSTRIGESDVKLLSTQLLSVRRGAVEVVQLLDKLQHGVNIRFGEIVRSDTPSYDKLEEVSRRRESLVEEHVSEIAEYERALDNLYKDGKISLNEQSKLYVEAVRDHVRAICIQYPHYTKDALGYDVIDDYQSAHEQYEKGDSAGAAQIVRGVSSRESAIVICGSSSESPNQDPKNPENRNDQTLEAILERQLQKDWKKLVERCPICGNESVWAQKKGEIITDLDFGCELNVCTKEFKIGSGVGNIDKSAANATLVGEKSSTPARDFEGDFQAIIEHTYGEGAVAVQHIEVGGTRTDIERGRKVIASNVNLGRLALARNS